MARSTRRRMPLWWMPPDQPSPFDPIPVEPPDTDEPDKPWEG